MSFVLGEVAIVTSSALALWRVGLNTAHELSRLTGAERTRNWLDKLINFEHTNYGWSESARAFWKYDTPSLMNSYYRGTPRALITSLADNAETILKTGNTEWMIEQVEEAFNTANVIASTLSGNVDAKRKHRLQVFPVLPAIQFLCLADSQTHKELCSIIKKTLEDTQDGRGPYTDSARDQINQIIPQILTDQLVASPGAWSNLTVTDEVINRLFNLANKKLRCEFETGFALSLQFLVYYELSLEMRPQNQSVCIQKAKINDFLRKIEKSSEPFLLDKQHWLANLKKQISVANEKPYGQLIRQSSSAIIAHAHRSHTMDENLLLLCSLNNLRAAVASYDLSDESVRLENIREFLTSNGITRSRAQKILEQFVSSSRKNFHRKAEQFVNTLPESSEEIQSNEYTFATAPGHTIGELISEVIPLVTEARSSPPPLKLYQIDRIIGKSLAKFIHALGSHHKMNLLLEQAEIKKLIRKIWEEQEL